MYVSDNIWCQDCRMYYTRSKLGVNLRGQTICPYCLSPLEVERMKYGVSIYYATYVEVDADTYDGAIQAARKAMDALSEEELRSVLSENEIFAEEVEE